MPHLTVSRIDPEAETQAYRDHILATKGATLDAQGRAMLEEDLRSPCTEEIAVFQAFSKVIREAGRKFVVMDTAPTGHTLLLLDATGSYHRDVLRHAGEEQAARMTTPMMRLQDPDKTKILIVTLPETTPVLEAARLQDDLGRAGITPYGWVVNASLAATGTTHPGARRPRRNRRGRDRTSARYPCHAPCRRANAGRGSDRPRPPARSQRPHPRPRLTKKGHPPCPHSNVISRSGSRWRSSPVSASARSRRGW